MRPRHILILLVLTALPVGLAFALTGGGSGPATSGAATLLSLKLVGGSNGGGITACGLTHHYTSYAAGSTIKFRGAISSPGSWSVKVKLKACSGGAFRPSGDAPAKVHSGVRFKGSFPAPIGGYYFARAELNRGGSRVARSDKRYFQVR